jgi:hypothetical protein
VDKRSLRLRRKKTSGEVSWVGRWGVCTGVMGGSVCWLGAWPFPLLFLEGVSATAAAEDAMVAFLALWRVDMRLCI